MEYKNKETVRTWVVPVGGNPSEITIPMEIDPDLKVWSFASCKDVAKAIGGNCSIVERYVPGRGVEIWIDEEGMMNRCPPNPFPSGLSGMPILGTVVILLDVATPHGAMVHKMLSSATTGSA